MPGLTAHSYVQDAPYYHRSAHAAPGEPLRLRGLGPGRVGIYFTVDGARDGLPTQLSLVSDGHTPLDLDYDLP